MTSPFGIWLFQEWRSNILGNPVPSLVGVHAAAHHHYTNPVPVGKRLIVHGKVIDKYIRHQRYYAVVEFWTVDEEGRDIVHITDTYLLTPVRIPKKADQI
jgi:protocatechuate 3,4-dioxygenase beta subunit